MAVIKLSQSKKALTFITDEGDVYTCAKGKVKEMIYNDVDTMIIYLTKMPNRISSTRFKRSLVFNPVTGKAEECTTPLVTNDIKANEDYMVSKRANNNVEDHNVW